MKSCDYGCGKEAKYSPRKGMTKWCCEKHYNKCSAQISLKTDILKKSGILKGKTPWNKGKKGVQVAWNKGKKWTEKSKNKMRIASKLTIRNIKQKYPFFSKEEEMRYNPDKPEEKEIQVHCKYNKCKNSKENGGWFTPTYNQLYERIRALEKKDGNDGQYLYCSEKCKQSCCLYYFRSDPNILKKFEKYNKIVYKETYKTLKKYKVKNSELRGKKHGYELDHKYSIYDGFINNVDPKIIGYYKNLEILTTTQNRIKKENSSITLEELLENIKGE